MPSRKNDYYNIYAVKYHLENESSFVNVKKLILNIQLECIVYYKTTS